VGGVSRQSRLLSAAALPVVHAAAPNPGFSTTWLLSALAANGGGELHSFDFGDQPSNLEPWLNQSGVTWHFHHGDIKTTFPALTPDGERRGGARQLRPRAHGPRGAT